MKYLLLGFFISVIGTMSAEAIYDFMTTPRYSVRPAPERPERNDRLLDLNMVGIKLLETRGFVYDKADKSLFCPCHNGRFNLEQGSPIAAPPTRPLPTIVLEEADCRIYATEREA